MIIHTLCKRASHFRSRLTAALLGASCGLAGIGADPGQSAAALEPQADASSAVCLGQVWHLAGDVEARSSLGSRKLGEGDFIYVGESVRASTASEAVVQTRDAGVIALRPNAEFVAEDYAAEARDTDHLRLRIVVGSLRLVSGWISTLNRPGTQVLTPAATISIKGTDYEPYVLPEDLADATPYEAGTYDKVNRGVTVLSSAAGEVEIKARQVGVAHLVKTAVRLNERDRSLMTLLLPTLIERAPDFYVAGQFDPAIDEYSQNAAALIQTRLAEARAGKADPSRCGALVKFAPGIDPRAVATEWISQLDVRMRDHDSAGVLALFADDAVIDASSQDPAGKTTATRFTPEQFSSSVRTAMAGLDHYEQRRQTLDAHTDAASGRPMTRVAIKTRVVEQGKMQGRTFRTESDEDYLLELREGRWLAVRAATTMR